MGQLGKSVLILVGALTGILICSILFGAIYPEDQTFFARRMLWAIGMGLVGVAICVGGYQALDSLTEGDWGGALLEGNMAVAVATGSLFIGIGLLLLGTVSVVM